MPAYFSADVIFEYRALYPDFVRDVYDIIIKNDFKFKQGFHIKDKSFDEIISWNQAKLEKKYRLGFDEHYINDYEQVLFENSLYNEIRAFWMFIGKDLIVLSIIIPESDILEERIYNKFNVTKLNPIIELMKNMWNTGLVINIQTSLEFDGGFTSLKSMKKGKAMPVINPFCILEERLYNEINKKLGQNIARTKLRNGFFILDETLI